MHNPVSQDEHQFTSFLIHNVVLGAWVGIGMAMLILLTNACGVLTLVLAQTDPIVPAVAFVAGGVMIFVPIVLAVAVGLAGRACQRWSPR